MSQEAEIKIGSVRVRKGSGKRRTRSSVSFRLYCDAAAVDQNGRMLLLSAAGDESAVKGLLAALRANDAHVTFDVEVPAEKEGEGGLHRHGAERHPDGYRVFRMRLADLGLWHTLCIAKVEGFLPVLTDDSLWQELRSERYTTPLLRSWVPCLLKRLKECGGLLLPEQASCTAGVLTVGQEALDALVGEGVASGALKIQEVAVAG